MANDNDVPICLNQLSVSLSS